MSLIGRVTSHKMSKTAVVCVSDKVKDKVCGKYLNRDKALFADDPKDICKEGDKVLIEQCRPVSKNKAWTVVKVLTD